MAKYWHLTLSLLIVMAAGCSRSAPLTAVPKSVPPSTTAAGSPTLPTPGNPDSTAKIKSEATLASTVAKSAPAVVPFSDLGELFAPPKNQAPVPEPVREPEPQQQAVPTQAKKKPELRLVGFVEVESVKALVSANGNVHVLSVGDSFEGFELAGISPPSVTLKNADDGQEFKLNLFEQAWVRRPGTNGMPRNSAGAAQGKSPGSTAGVNRPRVSGFTPADSPGFQGYPSPNGTPAGDGSRANKGG